MYSLVRHVDAVVLHLSLEGLLVVAVAAAEEVAACAHGLALHGTRVVVMARLLPLCATCN